MAKTAQTLIRDVENGKSLGRKGVAAICAVLLLVGCETRGGKIPYDPADFGPPDRPDVTANAYDIPLGPLDNLRISVFRVAELSGDYQVDSKGILNLPLIGRTSVRDMNSTQFADELERLYGQKYLASPDITVKVLNTNGLNVTVEGSVNAPGIYALGGRTTLLGAVATARGLIQDQSNPRRVAIFRKRDGKTVAAAFDLTAIRHGEMADPIIYPGDTIVVDGSKLRAIYRDLLQTLPTIAIFNSL